MIEFCNTVLNGILDNEWAMKLFTIICCLFSVAVVTLIKAIVVHAKKKQDPNYDKKNLEYGLSVMAFAVAFGLIVGFSFAHRNTEVWNNIVSSFTCSLSTQGLYILFCQPIHKTIKKVKTFFITVWLKVKSGKIKTVDVQKALDELIAVEECVVEEQNNEPKQPTSAVDEFYKYIKNE